MYCISRTDYKLLKYIRKAKNVTYKQMQLKFGKHIKSLDVRISNLTDNLHYLFQHSDERIESGHVIQQYKDGYSLTESGMIALQDYEEQRKYDLRILWLKNCWIPILVSVAVNIILYALIPWLQSMLIPLVEAVLCSHP